MIIWEYWCKAIGQKSYDENKKADVVAMIRTVWVSLHIVTCSMIILGNSKILGWW
jgi:hypothetical protein